jgi:hypothetical protein
MVLLLVTLRFSLLDAEPTDQQAQPPDLWQVFWREMQESPHGFDRALHCLQHRVDCR